MEGCDLVCAKRGMRGVRYRGVWYVYCYAGDTPPKTYSTVISPYHDRDWWREVGGWIAEAWVDIVGVGTGCTLPDSIAELANPIAQADTGKLLQWRNLLDIFFIIKIHRDLTLIVISSVL